MLKPVLSVTWFLLFFSGINLCMLQLVVRKLKKKEKLKNDGKWECEIGQDWSSHSNVELEGISESASNVCHCWNCYSYRSCIMSV